MAPFELRDSLLKQLRALRNRMMEFDFLLKVEALPAAERRQASQLLSPTQLAILRLQTEELSAFRDALIANEDDIKKAVSSAQEALDKLSKVQKTIEAASTVLKVVGRLFGIA